MFIGGLIFHVFSNALAILAAAYFVMGFVFKGNLSELLILAAVLTLINTFLRPILKLFLGPFIVLTFGLFTLVINTGILYFLDIYSPNLTIQGIQPLFLSTVIIAAVNFLVGFGAKFFYKK